METADQSGLVAVGGDLSSQRLKEAYYRGIFPWYEASQPVLWWSPDPRMVLFPEKLRISRSMQQLLKKDAFKVTFNKDFAAVIANCASAPRSGQNGTWITLEMQKAYKDLFRQGLVTSAEVWQGEELIGGLYGILLHDKRIFCGESMFSRQSNASKFGFIKLVENLISQGIRLIDCQMYTEHLKSLGAEEIDREEFLKYLA
ncbi:MAG TPA: leucyl/phenylalanyl-tRNA--protein transferase [Salinimicrobium sp.]|nr:leucyl/phenylalanyl-tRNA--protein transferase [Salinimicrobium sp.]